MIDDYDAAPQQSVTERQLQRLAVPAPAAYDPSKGIDVIHEPDLNLLWGGTE